MGWGKGLGKGEWKLAVKDSERYQPKPDSFSGTGRGKTMRDLEDEMERTINAMASTAAPDIDGRELLEWAGHLDTKIDEELADKVGHACGDSRRFEPTNCSSLRPRLHRGCTGKIFQVFQKAGSPDVARTGTMVQPRIGR